MDRVVIGISGKMKATPSGPNDLVNKRRASQSGLVLLKPSGLAARSAESGIGKCVLCWCYWSLLNAAARKVTWVTVWAVTIDREHGQAYV